MNFPRINVEIFSTDISHKMRFRFFIRRFTPLRRVDLTDPDFAKRGDLFSKVYRWASDLHEYADGCEYLYDKTGRLVGVDYVRRDAPFQVPVILEIKEIR